MIVNRATLSDLFRGYRLVFQQAFDGVAPEWNRIAMEVTSSTSEERYPWLGATTRFREWIGDRVIQNLRSYDFTIKNLPWENTVGVDRDHIEDDQYGIYTPMIAQLGMDAKQHPDEAVFALLKDGFTKLAYDGQFFFDTDHPVLQADGSVASVSNHGGGSSTAWYLLDDSRMIKPIILQMRKPYTFVAMDQATDEAVFNRKEFRYGVEARLNVGYGLWQLAHGSKQTLDTTNYSAARTAMMSQKGDNGRPLGLRPNLLVVPPALEPAALTILNAEMVANNTNIYRGTAKLMVNPYLA